MANVTTGKHLYFDSTGTVSGFHQILRIEWVSDDGSGDDIAADDDFRVVDKYGNEIAGKRAEVAGDDYAVDFAPPMPVEGINVDTLDGGVCRIHLLKKVA